MDVCTKNDSKHRAREKLIPSIVGRKALPIRLSGMGITDHSSTSNSEYDASIMVTKSLILEYQKPRREF